MTNRTEFEAAENVVSPFHHLRPLVARPVLNRAVWIFAGGLAILAFFLFSALEARRNSIVSPATFPDDQPSGALLAAPPALPIPNLGFEDDVYQNGQRRVTSNVTSRAGPVILQRAVRATGAVRPTPNVPPRQYPAFYDPNSPDPPYVAGPVPQYQPEAQAAIVNTTADIASSSPRLAGNRVAASQFANPATTVPQGAVIQAVLETALDSNRPGFVRAIVSRDVRSFDGSKVLIPRGSRLFGEYRADLARGQNRALIQWQTLTRPDGVQIAVNSPAADPLGRAGVKGSVNSHFFERFAGALLQSTLDLGVGLATRRATEGTVIIGLPGSLPTAQIGSAVEPIRPTLKVKHGATVSVFVARDLDFTAVN